MEKLLTVRDSKFTRVNELIEWGLNSPLYVKVDKDVIKNIKKLAMRWNASRFSVRAIQNLGKARYAFPNYTIKELMKYEEELEECKPVMVSLGVPIADSWAGCIQVFRHSDFILEAIKGPGNVRDLTHSRRIPDVIIISNFDSFNWYNYSEFQLTEVIRGAKKVFLENYILEFSIYNFPVGVRNENVLFWEYEIVKENLNWMLEISAKNHQIRKIT